MFYLEGIGETVLGFSGAYRSQVPPYLYGTTYPLTNYAGHTILGRNRDYQPFPRGGYYMSLNNINIKVVDCEDCEKCCEDFNQRLNSSTGLNTVQSDIYTFLTTIQNGWVPNSSIYDLLACEGYLNVKCIGPNGDIVYIKFNEGQLGLIPSGYIPQEFCYGMEGCENCPQKCFTLDACIDCPSE